MRQDEVSQTESLVEIRWRYLEQLRARVSTLTLPLRSDSADEPKIGRFHLTAIYQPLLLRSNPLAAEDLPRERRRPPLGEVPLEEQSEGDTYAGVPHEDEIPGVEHVHVESAAEALRHSPLRRMVVLGGPGSGKTTALKSLLLGAIDDALATDDAPLPVFLSLPDLARGGLTPRAYLRTQLGDLSIVEAFADVLWDAVESGQGFVCLDSLDEVAPAARPAMLALINRLAPSFGGVWVIGSRFTEYKGGQLAAGQFVEWELEPLTAEARLELARRLFPALRHTLGTQPGVHLSAAGFVAALAAHPQAGAWERNPLLFSLAAVAYARAGVLPSSRTALYGEVLDAILRLRALDDAERAQLRETLAAVALRVHATTGRTFARADLLAALDEIRRSGAAWETEVMGLRLLDTGVLEVVAAGTYAFQHQTFQEYLAAVALAHRLIAPDEPVRAAAWEQGWSKRTFSRWVEVLRMMASVLWHERHAEEALRWLRALAAQQEMPDGDVGHLGLALALRSLGELAGTGERANFAPVSELAAMEGELGARWLEALLDVVQRERSAACQEHLRMLADDIRHFGAPAVQPIIERLLSELTVEFSDFWSVAVEVLSIFGDRVPRERLRPLLAASYLPARSAGATLLARLEDEDAIDVLIQIVVDRAVEPTGYTADIWAGYHLAVNELTRLGTRVPVEPLVKLLREHPHRAAHDVLPVLGARAPLDWLLEALDDPTSGLREEAAQALGKLGGEVPVARLIARLDDPSERVRRRAVDALGTRCPIERLVSLLVDPDEDVRTAVVSALGSLGRLAPTEALIEAARDPRPKVRQEVAKVSGTLGNGAPLAVLTALLDDPHAEVRLTALAALARLGRTEIVVEWLAALANADATMRAAAVSVLGTQGPRVPLDLLTAALVNPVAGVRAAAAGAMESAGDRAPLDLLGQALYDEDFGVRMAAMATLEGLGTPAPVTPLVHVLHDEKPVRRQAWEILESMGEDIPIEPLVTVLRDPTAYNRSERADAARLLAQAGERCPVEPLVAALGDPSAQVQQAVLKTLKTLVDRGKRVPVGPVAALLIAPHAGYELEVAYRDAAETLGAIGPEARDVLLAALDLGAEGWQAQSLTNAVLDALAGWGDAEALDLLLGIVADTSAQLEVRRHALTLLPRLGERAPLDPVLAALAGEKAQWRITALDTLGYFGARAPLDKILEALADPNENIRCAALRALGRLPERAPVAPVMDALADPETQLCALATLTALSQRLDEAALLKLLLYLADRNIRYKVGDVLASRSGDMPVEPVAALLAVDSQEQRIGAVELLFRMEERGLPALLEALRPTNDDALREQILRVLLSFAMRKVAGPIPAAPLIAVLDEPAAPARLRVLALEILGKLDDHAVAPRIAAELTHPDAWTRRTAAEALCEMGARQYAGRIVALLDDADITVRYGVTKALECFREDTPDGVSQAVARMLGEASEMERAAAATTLGAFGAHAPAEELLPSLADTSAWVRGDIVEALRSNHPEALEAVAGEAEAVLREQRPGAVLGALARGYIADAVGTLSHAPQELLEQVTNLLDDPFWEVRLRAVRAVAKHGRTIPDRALRRLLALRQDSASRAVREAADDALAEILTLETGIEDEE